MDPKVPQSNPTRGELIQTTCEYAARMMVERQLEEAKKAYRHVLELDATHGAALNNLAMILQHEGQYLEARKLYKRALDSKSDSLPIRYNHSICCLADGLLEEGWSDFAISEPHWRQLQDRRQNLPWMNRPLWDGSDLQGKKILLWGDQGIGDEILYASLLPDLIKHGAEIMVECMDRLVPLFARSFPSVTVVPRQDPPLPSGHFDYHAPGMWLARCLRPSKDSFQPLPSFLKADPEKVSLLRRRYEAFGKQRIVGLSWFTGSVPWGLKRSFPLPTMLKPLALDDMLIVDLQYGNTAEAWKEAGRVFPSLTSFRDPDVNQMKDMDLFAAQVAACDVVLTIGNTTAHVAGAVGVPTCALMPDISLTWFWFATGEQCPWYPCVTLLRPSLPDRLSRMALMAKGTDRSLA